MGAPSTYEDILEKTIELKSQMEDFDAVFEYLPSSHNETILNFYNAAKSQRQQAMSYLSTLNEVIELSKEKGYDILVELMQQNKLYEKEIKSLKKKYEEQDLFKLYQKTLQENLKLKSTPNSNRNLLIKNDKGENHKRKESEQEIIIKNIIRTQVIEIQVDQKNKMSVVEGKLFEVENKLKFIHDMLYNLISRQTTNKNIKPLELMMKHLKEAQDMARDEN